MDSDIGKTEPTSDADESNSTNSSLESEKNKLIEKKDHILLETLLWGCLRKVGAVDFVIGWINESFEGSLINSMKFINEITTYISKIIYNERKNFRENIVERILKVFVKIFTTYINESAHQLICLLSVQKFLNSVDYPKGLLENVFKSLFDLELIPYESFIQWKLFNITRTNNLRPKIALTELRNFFQNIDDVQLEKHPKSQSDVISLETSKEYISNSYPFAETAEFSVIMETEENAGKYHDVENYNQQEENDILATLSPRSAVRKISSRAGSTQSTRNFILTHDLDSSSINVSYEEIHLRLTKVTPEDLLYLEYPWHSIFGNPLSSVNHRKLEYAASYIIELVCQNPTLFNFYADLCADINDKVYGFYPVLKDKCKNYCNKIADEYNKKTSSQEYTIEIPNLNIELEEHKVDVENEKKINIGLCSFIKNLNERRVMTDYEFLECLDFLLRLGSECFCEMCADPNGKNKLPFSKMLLHIENAIRLTNLPYGTKDRLAALLKFNEPISCKPSI